MHDFKSITELARQLRKNETPSEKILWEILRNRKLSGYKFLRQHPFVYVNFQRPLFFIADFYCAELLLVIEVDGKIHEYQNDRDEQRDIIMKEKGLRVLRIKNDEVRNIEKVKKNILAFK